MDTKNIETELLQSLSKVSFALLEQCLDNIESLSPKERIDVMLKAVALLIRVLDKHQLPENKQSEFEQLLLRINQEQQRVLIN